MLFGQRGDRRARTLQHALRRRADHADVHRFDTLDCICEAAVFFFAKRRAHGGCCRRKRPGRPRLARGICRYHWRKPLYRERRRWRDLELALRARVVDLEAV